MRVNGLGGETMIKILELFGGIGACTKAFERLGIEHEIVDYVEIDKFAVRTYNVIHYTKFKPQDITKWDRRDIDVDLICHGSPCQDFSTAGFQRGGDIESGTRSSLMYESIRIIGRLRPKYVIWENVKNLLSNKHMHNFNLYMDTMKGLGYTNYHQVLNSLDYGIPQHRNRVFVISIRNDLKQPFIFPPKQILTTNLSDFLTDKKYILARDDYKEFTNYFIFSRKSDNQMINGSWNRIWNVNKIVGTLPARHNIIKVGEVIDGKLHYKILDAKESFRLMGFDDTDYERAIGVNANSTLMRQAGNSIVVPVLEAILKELLLCNEQLKIA